MNINIPGFGQQDIHHVVFDYNGTIACDGELLSGVKEEINTLSDQINFHVITADTFGFVKTQLQDVNTALTIISNDNQDRKKLDYINTLGADQTLCAGNGANDKLMLKQACIGIAVLGNEGLASSSLAAADLLVKDILDVFRFFKTPQRLIASLRT